MTTASTEPTAIHHTPLLEQPADPRRWLALLVILTGTFVVVLDFFIVNVAIPSMGRSLQASSGAIEWVIAAYGLAYAAGLITAGRLGDLYGRRRMFAVGLALFTLASLGCGAAPNSELLIVARVIQGIAAAIISPQALSLLGILYAGTDRVRAFTAYGLTLGLASVCGQLIGGVLIRADIAGLDWRACFLINVPIGIAALAVMSRLLPESRTGDGGTLDLRGAALLTLALTALLVPLIDGREQGWPVWSWLCLAGSLVLLLVFIWYERWAGMQSRGQLIDPALFRERAFTVGLLTTLTHFAGQTAFFLILALYLQEGRGLAPLTSGLIFTVVAAGFFVTSMCAPALTRRLDRQSLALGALGLACGQALLGVLVAHIGLSGNILLLLPALVFDGAGIGLVIAPLTSTVLAGIAPGHAGAAAGILTAMQQLGAAVGVAAIGIIFYGDLGPSAAPAAYPHAFAASLIYLAVLALAAAMLIQLLPHARK